MVTDNPYAPPIAATETTPAGQVDAPDPPPTAESFVDADVVEDDIVAYYVFHAQQSSWGRRSLTRQRIWVGVYVAVIVGSGSPGLTAGHDYPGLLAFFTTVGIFAGAAVLGYPLLHRFIVSQTARRSLRRGRNLAVLGPRRVRITPQALEIEGPYGSSRTRWAAMERIEMSELAIAFYTSSIGAEIVPIRCFESPQRLRAFVDLARRHHAAAQA